MAREKHSIEISAWLEPDEHDDEAQAWETLQARLRETFEQLRADPALAPIADRLDLDISPYKIP
ncbi:hypothetical protein [Sphaerimonospora mesophila]|uniref:hypothetical protein n=1 Tax=Sphaerimonospora mesophila TaxID=37483 RepID=UPI0006E1BE70